MKYLSENIRTLEELKKAYHRLCLKLHPDVGGSDEEMKILNAEYETLFERVKISMSTKMARPTSAKPTKRRRNFKP